LDSEPEVTGLGGLRLLRVFEHHDEEHGADNVEHEDRDIGQAR
jgi:hypothetical protein